MDAETLWSELEFATPVEVASKYGLSSRRLTEILDAAGYTGKLPNEPSVTEIEEAARDIRRGWSPDVAASRYVGRAIR